MFLAAVLFLAKNLLLVVRMMTIGTAKTVIMEIVVARDGARKGLSLPRRQSIS
jgi:hypothetical protein